MYNPEKVQKQKRLIGAVAIVLLIIVTILAITRVIDNVIVWILIDLVIFGVANLLIRRVGKVPL